MLSRQHDRAPARLDPFNVYRALRMVNPSPYMYFLKDGATRRSPGASPEMLVRVEGRRVGDAAPRRHAPARRDRGGGRARSSSELLADEKERAEHLMLVDLGRNDLGRVCRFGSVQRARAHDASSATATSCTS